jgi:hypothetical protein
MPYIATRRPLLYTPPVAAGGALGLQTSLGAFYSLDNTLADATGNLTDLTNNNTVTFVTPPGAGLAAVTNCANFVEASSQTLSHASNSAIDVAGSDFSVSFWYYCTNNGGSTYVDKANGAFGSREFRIDSTFTGGNSPIRGVVIPGSATAITSSNQSKNAWHHVVFTYVNSSNLQTLYIDGSSAASGTAENDPAGTNTLTIGGQSASAYLNGNMALVGIWKGRTLSSGDVTALYNSGAGRSYAAMA